MSDQQPWHRLFGLSWKDRLAGQPVTIEAEPDLSAKQQRLDLVIVREDELKLASPLPDGFEELAPHNVISFKSFREALDGEVIEELIGHGVNYRKLIKELPAGLALKAVRPGVYNSYSEEGIPMSFDLDQYAKELREKWLRKDLAEFPPERVLEYLPDKVLEVLPLEKRLEGLTPEQRVQGLSVETLEAL